MALRKLTASVSTVWAKATAMVVAVNNRTGELDTNFNGTGELINSDYGVALTGRIASSGGTADDLSVVYGTAGTYASAFVDYPHHRVGSRHPPPQDEPDRHLQRPQRFRLRSGIHHQLQRAAPDQRQHQFQTRRC